MGRNLAANLIGRFLGAVLVLVLVPIYVKLLGSESYGLIGLFASIQGIMSLLDLGLATTLSRELARSDHHETGWKAVGAASLVRSLELPYAAIGLLAGLAVVAAAPYVAGSWVKAETLTPAEISRAVGLMGLTLAAQWPSGLYQNGLIGLQRQVTANIVNLAGSIIRGVGAVVVLKVFAPTVTGFFLWQAISAVLTTLLVRAFLYAALPPAEGKTRFRLDVLRGQIPFAAGLTGTAVLAILMTQLDKIVLSKMATLAEFGYYTMAATLANSVYQLAGPVSAAAFPRFTELLTAGDLEALRRSYHRVSQFASLLILAPALTLACLPEAAALAWTGNPVLARTIAPLVMFLATGTGLHALVYLPAQLQLAKGLSRLGLFTNMAMTAGFVPLLLALVLGHGVRGGAIAWTVLGAAYVLCVPLVTHRYVLKGEAARWLLLDVARPIAAILVPVLILRSLLPVPSSRGGAFGLLALAGTLASTVGLLSSPEARRTLVERLLRRHQPR